MIGCKKFDKFTIFLQPMPWEFYKIFYEN